jgi:signal transduction histidine kinase
LEYHIYPSSDGISIYFQDITKRKQAEAQRQQLYQQAQEANRLKHEFLLTLSHELRTPLNAILGWSNLILQVTPQSERLQRGIEVINLRHVVWHLLSNAIKFTPNEGHVQTKIFQQDEWICLEMMDSGKGIEPEFLPHAFEDFRQANSSTTRCFGGLGLGLAIVRYLTEMHGGTIELSSAGENQGTTATVKLPMALQSRETTPYFFSIC